MGRERNNAVRSRYDEPRIRDYGTLVELVGGRPRRSAATNRARRSAARERARTARA